MMVETGFRQLEFQEIEFKEGTSLSGQAENEGDALLNADGTKKTLVDKGAYLRLGFNLHF
jgi:hypothetical protein